ncbi:MAG: hypothetical protein IAG10_04955, partial [Planctomycetaceae bacterium]|nr:hypothetical protein [Planctomycetaceae bacterium]
MQTNTTTNLRRALVVVFALLICKVTVAVMLGYPNYFPPNFQSDFLQGREGYFFGTYQWAFYPHIASGPAALFLGMLLISFQLLERVHYDILIISLRKPSNVRHLSPTQPILII